MSISKEDLFTGKTNEYDRLRPQYPDELFNAFVECTKPKANVADVGAGTGYVSISLFEKGYHVEAIEPNDDMRNVLLRKIDHDQLNVRQGNAQSTTLQDKSVDIITLGNVAHWLDGKPEKLDLCLKEFKRVLRHNGKIAVFSLSPMIENNWISDIFNMAQKYDPTFDIERIEKTFSEHEFHARNFMFDPIKSIDKEITRVMNKIDFYDFMISHSFCDDRMKEEINDIFKRYSRGNEIDVHFKSSVYIGSLKPA